MPESLFGSARTRGLTVHEVAIFLRRDETVAVGIDFTEDLREAFKARCFGLAQLAVTIGIEITFTV